jgi:TPR repeat protein
MMRSRVASQGALIILVVLTASLALADAPKSGKGHDEQTFDNHYQGCNDWNDGRACTNIGIMYAQGRGVAKDETKAVEFYEKGCKYNDPAGCLALGIALLSGTGVAKDPAKAAQAFEKACDRSDLRGCADLGFLLITGQGVAKDEAKAVQLFQKACDGGNATGCNNIYGYHATACQAGDAERCLEGARWAQAKLKKADLPEGVQFDQGSVARLLQTACDGGKAQGCVDLGAMYSKGDGVVQDKAKAAELSQKACNLGLTTACGKH